MSGYAELCCVSAFSFQRGASVPEELVLQAAKLGYEAIAITDECSLAGAVRALQAAETARDTHGIAIKLILGTRLMLAEGIEIVLLARDFAGYTQLCRLITEARRRATKGHYGISQTDIEGRDLSGCRLLVLPVHDVASGASLHTVLAWLSATWPHQSGIALALHRQARDGAHLQSLENLRTRYGLPLVAVGDVHMHRRSRRALQDVFTALRFNTTVAEAGYRLASNGERYLRPIATIKKLYPAHAIEAARWAAADCSFSLRTIEYKYPSELVDDTRSADDLLKKYVHRGCATIWPEGIPAKTKKQIDSELEVIGRMNYAHYFLTVYDIVREANQRGILCQGRGSAANSAVCYCLGITAVDPTRNELLFERFISEARKEPPDIDVDFEHERREEIIQYIYAKYGRHRAALAATVIHYRPRSAMRDVGRVMGLSVDQIDRLSAALSRRSDDGSLGDQLAEHGIDIGQPLLEKILWLVNDLIGFPRHLSQHVGGFVLSDRPLEELVPVENADMPDRTIIQWDKDDLEAVGLMKIDVLALGMLSCIRRCFDLIESHTGQRLSMASIPGGDAPTYAMIQKADTIGVFQIESRAQMTMLPRLKPARFFDLVVEVAIVRPGPIQGGMVHPYLEARNKNPADIEYPSEALRGVLERTLGVPIFQEQVMKIAMVAAGFNGNEANGLRKSMAAWKKEGGLESWRERLKSGMRANGYDDDFADRIFEQIKGFGSYGFPESHAVSFALLVYISAWLKCHYPAAFTAALLNSQPMGFYGPSQLVTDARNHAVDVRKPDVRYSDWDCTLETVPGVAAANEPRPALRLGLSRVKGLSPDAAQRLVAARSCGGFRNVADLVQRAALDRRARDALARADALEGLAGNRHNAQWHIAAARVHDDLFADLDPPEDPIALPEPAEGTDIISDYANLGLTLRRHPLALLRKTLSRKGVLHARSFNRLADQQTAHVAGLTTIRQRPGSAKGTTFVTIEDETGPVNVVIWPSVFAQYRVAVTSARLLRVIGHMQRAGPVTHCVARHIVDDSALLGALSVRSRDFH